ncbi:MAG: hypothetical protein ABI615_10360 [Chthoniobacterales bacterium]
MRWREPIWKPKQSKKAKPRIIGDRQVTAQVDSRDDDGFAALTVMHCVSKRDELWIRELPQLKTGEKIRRSAATLAKGGAERAPWGGSDGESVRSLLTSEFRKAAEGKD